MACSVCRAFTDLTEAWERVRGEAGKMRHFVDKDRSLDGYIYGAIETFDQMLSTCNMQMPCRCVGRGEEKKP